MKAQTFRAASAIVLLCVACSDAGVDTSGTPGAAGMNALAGSAGQPISAGTGGGAGTGAAFGGAAGAAMGGSANAGMAGSSAGAAGLSGGGGAMPTDGKGLYDANCKQCHGEQGSGSLLAPELVHPVRDYSTWVVRNGRAQTTFVKPMDKFGTDKLSDAQLMLIWDYLDMPPQPTTAKALYDDYCGNCHGADGKGGPTMRDVTNEVGKVLTQVRSGKNVGKFAMRRDYMPAFPAGDISDAELNLIRDYVNSL